MSKNKKIPILDLHGYKEDQVFDAIDSFLRKHASKPTVHIMTGKGKGIVKKKALEYLKLSGYTAKPLRGESGQVNDGVLVVYMN